MATAPGPLRTIAGNLCLGSAPDSWGIWFPEDEQQVPYTRFLDELATAGYEWLELGPYGYLPTDPQRLKAELDARGLQVSGGTAFGALHRPEAWDEMLAHVRQVAAADRGRRRAPPRPASRRCTGTRRPARSPSRPS